MDERRLGALVRLVRRRRGLRQIDVAAAAGVSDSTVSLVERGHWRKLSLDTLARIAASLDIRVDVTAYWRGGDAARLLSAAHSRLADAVASSLVGSGWTVEPEVSFSVYGERGVIDQLARHEASRHLLVIELKTEIVDVNELLGTFDRKLRLARGIARERGWDVGGVSGWLIVTDTSANRRHAALHRSLLRARFHDDGRTFRAFLSRPTESTTGLAFWPDSNAGGAIREGGALTAGPRIRKRR